MKRACLIAAGWLGVILPDARAAECPAIDRSAAASPARHCPAVDRVGAPRLRVYLDRRSGKLRPPTPEEARALYASGGRGLEYLEPVEVVVHPNGMRTVDLKGAFSQSLVIRRNPEGSLSTRCVPAAAVVGEK